MGFCFYRKEQAQSQASLPSLELTSVLGLSLRVKLFQKASICRQRGSRKSWGYQRSRLISLQSCMRNKIEWLLHTYQSGSQQSYPESMQASTLYDLKEMYRTYQPRPNLSGTGSPSTALFALSMRLLFFGISLPLSRSPIPPMYFTHKGPDPSIKLFIDIEKSLQYSEELGWNWHKSWNLPNISVKLQIKDSSTGQSMLAPPNLFAHIFAVKIVDSHEKPDSLHLQDVGIRGISKIDMTQSQAFFTTMKFESTSYNNDGVKFHLLLCLYIQGDEGEQPRVLLATISPHIFVDSRKSARDNQEKKYTSFIEPFPTDSLEKQFIKRENKKKNDSEFRIQNDHDGFLNYLTAPNIRHKVKHPAFLILRFSSSCALYYNTNLINSHDFSDILQVLQRKLIKDHSKKQLKLNRREEKWFILLITVPNDPLKNKKIAQAIQPLESSSVHITFNKQEITSQFSHLEYKDQLLQTYRKTYSQLNSICKSNASQFFQKNEEDSEESDSAYSQESLGSMPRKRQFLQASKEIQHIQQLRKDDQSNKIQQENQLLKNFVLNKLGIAPQTLSSVLLGQQSSTPPTVQPPPQQQASFTSNNTAHSFGMGSAPPRMQQSPKANEQIQKLMQNNLLLNRLPFKGLQLVSSLNQLITLQNLINNYGGVIPGLSSAGLSGTNLNKPPTTQIPLLSNTQTQGPVPGLNLASLQALQNLQTLQQIQGLQGLQNLQGLQGLQGLQTSMGLAGLGLNNLFNNQTNNLGLGGMGMTGLSNLNLLNQGPLQTPPTPTSQSTHAQPSTAGRAKPVRKQGFKLAGQNKPDQTKQEQ